MFSLYMWADHIRVPVPAPSCCSSTAGGMWQSAGLLYVLDEVLVILEDVQGQAHKGRTGSPKTHSQGHTESLKTQTHKGHTVSPKTQAHKCHTESPKTQTHKGHTEP